MNKSQILKKHVRRAKKTMPPMMPPAVPPMMPPATPPPAMGGAPMPGQNPLMG